MFRPESPFHTQMQRWAQKARRPRLGFERPDDEVLLSFPAHYLDLVITAANVIPGAGKKLKIGIAGANLTAGQSIYKDASDGLIKPADANASATTAAAAGITTHGALTGQPVQYQDGGILAFGAILTVGHIYVVSATPGGIAPHTDLASTWRTAILGIAVTTSNLQMDPGSWRAGDVAIA